MSDFLDRRKFLKMTGAAGFGLGLFSTADFAGAKPGEPPSEKNRLHKHARPKGPYSTRREWSGPDLWEKTVTSGLRFDQGTISLDDHILIEDDAPAIGAVQSHVWERIEYGTVLEKHLQVDRWPVSEAMVTMLVYPVEPGGAMSGGELEVQVNGNDPIIYELKHFWTSVPVPADQLRFGTNRILVTVHGEDTVFRMPIAQASHYKYGSLEREAPSPQRSRRSTDRGGTWSENLGSANAVNGEYPIRLTLRTRQAEGWLRTPVIDLTDSDTPLHHPSTVEQARVDLQLARRGEESAVSIWLRSGTTHRPEAGGWSNWEELRSEDIPSEHLNRFVQLKVDFESESGSSTPLLESLQVESRVRPEGDEPSVHFLDGVNRPLIDKPHSFEHEDPLYGELQEFREQYELDKIVKGARNEMELILRLNNWAAGRWNWHMPSANVPDVIEWNAENILDPEDDALEPGGYCLLYSVVLAQACQSFGIPARMVNLNYAIFGGHEVIEVWSREYQKWFMVDPNFDSIFVWRDSGEPANVLELHDIFLETYYPNGEIVDRDAWTDEERDRRGASADPEEMPVRFQTDGHALSGELGNDYVWWKVTEAPAPGYAGGYGLFNTAYVRWLPRSNWMSQPLPTPVTHGRTHWGWDGYLAWTDEQTPRTQEHRHFLRKEQEIYDRLFTVDYSAEPMEEDGAVRVWLATESPGFSHFELIHNGRRSKTRSSSFRWELARGVNRLEMRSVDVLGNRGPASELTVNYMSS